METSSPTYLAAGWFIPAATTGWFNNASVTPTLSAVIYGSGNGASGNEQDWYLLPNVTGLNNTHQYQLKFRLASYTFSSPAAATRGLDAADIVDAPIAYLVKYLVGFSFLPTDLLCSSLATLIV